MEIDQTNPILCGTDFSGNAAQAAIVADALARLGAPQILAASVAQTAIAHSLRPALVVRAREHQFIKISTPS